MAKLILSMFMSLDGYIEPPAGFEPPPWSKDVEAKWSQAALAGAGHLIYGRVNFLFNKAFWSAAETDPASPAATISYAATMNRLPKTVASRMLTGDPGWNARIVAQDLPGAVAALKRETQGDIFCFGGAGLANSLVALDLVDEFRLMVTPLLFGDGKRLFGPGRRRLAIRHVETAPTDVGSVILRYARERGEAA